MYYFTNTLIIEVMISIKNLNFNYGKNKVFSNLDLNIECGKIYGLLGENGVGKTTLLKLISGLLPVKKGSCTVCEHIPYNREVLFLESICYVPEEISCPSISLIDYGRNRGEFYPAFNMDEYIGYLTQFELQSDMNFQKISYGQKKKAVIAFAFATNTKILLMDKPSNGLDIPSKSQLRKIISANASEERCIIISTHQVRDLENIIDPIIILDKDAVLLNASVEEISRKLSFRFNDRESADALHNEQSIGGYISVEENITGSDDNVNIEALFNATIKNRKRIQTIFNSK